MVDMLLTTIVVGTIAIIVLLVFVVYRTWKRRKEGSLSPANYRSFFILGLVWFVVGSALMVASLYMGMSVLFAIPLFAIGAIYLIIALLNRDKWWK
jgi:cytochrome c oxidase assembly factor CtaG